MTTLIQHAKRTYMNLSTNDLEKMTAFLAKKINVNEQDLCFCGSGSIYKTCCQKKPSYWITDKYLKKLIGYGKHKNFQVTTIPTTFLHQLELDFHSKFNICNIPRCDRKAINSHVFGKALLKKYFNTDQCKWYAINDLGEKELRIAGIKSEIGYQIFCSQHDHEIFSKIDALSSDNNNEENQLLHIFRSLAYQNEFNRVHLAINHQLIYALPKIIDERSKHTGVMEKEYQINLSTLAESHARYKLTSFELEKIWNIIQNKELQSLKIASRIIKSDELFFAQGIENPSLDLLNKKIPFSRHIAMLYVVLPFLEKRVQVIFITTYDEYFDFIEQVKTVSEEILSEFLNSALDKKNSSRAVLVGLNKNPGQKILSIDLD